MWFNKKESVEKASTGDFIVVIHNWFVRSNGFETHILRGVTKQQAKDFGNQKIGEMTNTFNHVAFTIFEVVSNE